MYPRSLVSCRAFIRALWLTLFVLAVSSGAVHAQYWFPDTTGLAVPIGSLAVDANGVIFAGAETFSRGGGISPAGIFRSTDNGHSWIAPPVTTDLSGDNVTLGPVLGINPKGTNVAGDIFCVGGYFEFRSADEGASWQEFQLEPGNPFDPTIDAFTAFPLAATGKCNLFIATGSTGIYVSENDGTTWSDDGLLFDSSFATCVAATPWGAIFQASTTGLERGASQNGETFDSTIAGSPMLGEGIKIASNATGLIVAGGTGGLFFTVDTGNVWEPINPPGSGLNTTNYILAVAADGDIYVGINNFLSGTQGGIVVSKDVGRTWQDISSGLITDTINALAFNNNGELFCATDNGVFTFNPSGSGVSDGNDMQPSLTLEQNSPNPFTTTTNIRFTLPEAGQVSLRVFDPTGREVSVAVGGYYSPGTYTTSFNAEGLSDGAYYFRLEADGQSVARMFVIEH